MNEHELLIVRAAASILRAEAARLLEHHRIDCESARRHAIRSLGLAADECEYALRCVAEAGS